eukprot:6207433-Pleurochrysis_carterae.AAC.2
MSSTSHCMCTARFHMNRRVEAQVRGEKEARESESERKRIRLGLEEELARALQSDACAKSEWWTDVETVVRKRIEVVTSSVAPETATRVSKLKEISKSLDHARAEGSQREIANASGIGNDSVAWRKQKREIGLMWQRAAAEATARAEPNRRGASHVLSDVATSSSHTTPRHVARKGWNSSSYLHTAQRESRHMAE